MKKKKTPRPNPVDEIDDTVVEIDEAQLDQEWLDQPRKYLRFAMKAAEADRKVAEAKAALDLCKAEIELAIRNDPERYELEKVSEAGVKAAVLKDEEHQTMIRRFNRAKHLKDVYDAVLTALEHRKRALENLVSLYGQSYFSTPRAKGGSEEARAVERRVARKRTRGD